MTTVFISLGSNLGNKRLHLITAMALLAEQAGEIVKVSGLYETAPWGFDSPHTFLNAAVQLETPMSPTDLLAVTQRIERELGRTNKTEGTNYHDRTIDIDILLYGDMIIETPELTIPHPSMSRRLFVMQPVAEIAPSLRHPVLNATMDELLEDLM